MSRKIAVIFGTTGQDGSYLSELLLEKDYEVVGIKRRSSTDTTERIQGFQDHANFKLVEGDLIDPSSVIEIITTHQPDEVYNLAAQSHVGTSFKQPSVTFQIDAMGVLNILEAIRLHKNDVRFYQASTSEMFGSNASIRDEDVKVGSDMKYHYQDEDTPLAPNSPYAIAKTAAHNLVACYRQAYDIYGSCGILFNHESERRGEEFVTRKITKWLGEFRIWHDDHPRVFESGQIFTWLQQNHDEYIYQSLTSSTGFPKLRLGNLDAKRDWGHAEDYVRGMWMMLQQDKPDDYVLATGKTHSIRDFLDVAFKEAYFSHWEDKVYIDPEFYRPLDVEYLLGSPTKANTVLGWKPEVSFEELVKRMVAHDIKVACRKDRKQGMVS